MKPASARRAVAEAADTAVAEVVDMEVVAAAAAVGMAAVVEAAATAVAAVDMATVVIEVRGGTKDCLLHSAPPRFF